MKGFIKLKRPSEECNNPTTNKTREEKVENNDTAIQPASTLEKETTIKPHHPCFKGREKQTNKEIKQDRKLKYIVRHQP